MEIDTSLPMYTGVSESTGLPHVCFGQIKKVGSEVIYGRAICEDGSLFVKDLRDGLSIPSDSRLCWRCFMKLSRLMSEAGEEEAFGRISSFQSAAIGGMFEEQCRLEIQQAGQRQLWLVSSEAAGA